MVGCTLVRDLDANDLYAGIPGRDTGHFSDAIPAVLADAEAVGANGRELLTAIVAVYELQAALADAYLWMHRGLHSVSQVAWALPAVLGRLRRMPRDRVVSAIGTAGTMTGLILQSWLGTGDITEIKAISTGLAAAGAVRAADLAEKGLSAPPNALETLFRRLPSDGRTERFSYLTGCVPTAVERMIFKRYPAQIYVQAAIEAAIAARHHLNLNGPEDIECINLWGHSQVAAGVQGGPEAFRPTTRESADHSTPFAVAVAVRDGDLSAASYHGEPWTDPGIVRLMDRTALTVDPAFDRELNERGRLGCRLIMQTVDGREATAVVTQQHGHPDRPLNTEQFQAKAASLVDPELGDGAAGQLWEVVEYLPNLRSIKPLVSACVPSRRGTRRGGR